MSGEHLSDQAEKGASEAARNGREALIASALSLVKERGYAALSVSAICKRAGVSAPSLYHHFGDKAGLLLALIEECLAQDATAMMSKIEGKEPPLQRLQRFIAIFREFFTGRTVDTATVVFAISQGRGESEAIANAVDKAQRAIVTFTAARFADILGMKDAQVFADLFLSFAAYLSQIAQTSAPDRDERLHRAVKHFERFFILGIGAERPEFLKDADFAAAHAKAASPQLA
ncbi:transcriptional regulatory protein [Parvularcula bermudensis HTCC2503]|uniref:Transcriptional regulatory protein n=1 Tax=Parvularcula bermudensis (strain ATCC BAA-594 / HTCC2503 / KCTC 12087) TaxID=314260 RepID=E0TBK8_PARBH|nr:TetR/AcrR family transcriptional regulator [Parvularcula bermudensis]ADM08383.1 transcriptional regulatory protein [Parvularcula bermudensis HTCC2503]